VHGSLANEDEVDGSVGSVMARQREKTWENETVRERKSCRSLIRAQEEEGERKRERDAGAF